MEQSYKSQQTTHAKNNINKINIGQKQRNVRGMLGIVVLGLSAMLTFKMIQGGTNFWSAILLLVLLQNGIMLVMEWNMGVCPVNAMRGRQSMTGWFSIGKEDVKDQQRVKAARRAALKQIIWSTIMAVAITGLVLLL